MQKNSIFFNKFNAKFGKELASTSFKHEMKEDIHRQCPSDSRLI